MQEGISKSATDNIRAGMTLGLMPLHLNTFISTFYYYWQSIGSSNSMNLVAKAEISRLKRTQVSVRGWCGILVDESHLKLSSDLHPSFLTFVTSCLMKRGLHHLHSWWFPRCSHCILSLSGRHGFHGSTSSRAEWGLSFPGHSSLPVPSPAPGRCPGRVSQWQDAVVAERPPKGRPQPPLMSATPRGLQDWPAPVSRPKPPLTSAPALWLKRMGVLLCHMACAKEMYLPLNI